MTDDIIAQRIAAGRALEQDGTEQQAIDYFLALAAEYPDSATVQFETGGAYDFAGYEAEAVPYYRRAIALGLPDDMLPQVAVQLGSSLRNLGQFDAAVQTLQEASDRYPEYRALKAFLALALHSAGRPADALALMIRLTVEPPGFYERYHRSLRGYADELTNGQP